MLSLYGYLKIEKGKTNYITCNIINKEGKFVEFQSQIIKDIYQDCQIRYNDILGLEFRESKKR